MKTQCPHCKARFNAPDSAAGKNVKCPKCQQQFTIVALEQATPQELCTSCKAAIGPQEQAFIHNNNIVCQRCYEKLKSPVPKPPAPEPKAVKETKPDNLFKTIFVYSWVVVRIIAGIVCVLGLALAIKAKAQSTAQIALAAGGLLVIVSVLIELAFFYKIHSAIYSDDKQSTSPVKAVAFLFIPLFNIYWALYMLVGFAEDYNEFIQRNAIKTKDLSPTLFLIYSVAFILSSMTVTVPMTVMFAFAQHIKKGFAAYTSISWFLLAFVTVVAISHFATYTISATKTCSAIKALKST